MGGTSSIARVRSLICLSLFAVGACGSEQNMTEGTSGTSGSSSPTTDATSTTTDDVPPPPPPPAVVWNHQLEVGEDVGAFFGVWGESADDMIVVGGQVTQGVIYRNRSGAWEPETLDIDVPRLNWVYGIDGEIVIVGHEGTALHLDEGAWVREPTPTQARLWGVWGAAANDLWAVGGNTGDDNPPVLLHWQGNEWEEVVFEPETDARALFKVWGSAADDVFAVGDRGLVAHYDGAAWSSQDSGTMSSIIGVWGRAPDDVVISGGRSSGIVVRNAKGEWSGRRFNEFEGFDGAFMEPDGTTTVVGRRGFIGRFPAKSLTFVEEVSNSQVELHSVFGLPDGRLFAVGGLFDTTPYAAGVILERPLEDDGD